MDALFELMDGAGLNHLTDKVLRVFTRVGNNHALVPTIIPMIPTHDTYIEPFAGSAAVFFNKPRANVNVLNDLDKRSYQRLKWLQRAPLDIKEYPSSHTKEDHIKILRSIPSTTAEKLIKAYIEDSAGYRGMKLIDIDHIYNVYNTQSTALKYVKAIPLLKGVKIFNKDYADVIAEYDSPTSFSFIDPPYEGSMNKFGYAESAEFDYDRLKDVIDKIRGMFMLTLNDSPYIRSLFKAYNIKSVDIESHMKDKSGKAGRRSELIITNY